MEKTVLQALMINNNKGVWVYVRTPLHGGDLRLQSEPDLFLESAVTRKVGVSTTVCEGHELGSCVCVCLRVIVCVCLCIHSQPPAPALPVPSLEQPLNAMFYSVAIPVPLQSQHLHIPIDQWYWQGYNRSNCLLQIISGKSLQFQEDGWGTG